MLVLIVVGKKFKVYHETKYSNGYYRQLIGTFKSAASANRFIASH